MHELNSHSPWKRPWWLAFLDKTNLTVTGLTAGFIILTYSAGAAYFAAGALMCSMTVKLLKRAIRQPRPVNHSSRKVTYGMPSTHSATIAYYATYIPFACMYLPIHRSLPQDALTRMIPPLIALPWAYLIAASRVWLGHHTWPQVAVGCCYGVGFAILWFYLWVNGLDERGQTVEDVLCSYLGC